MAVFKAGEAFRRTLGPASLLLATAAVASECQVVGEYQSFEPHPCNALPSSKPDENGLNTLVLSKQSDGSCYWIDWTEVTVERYRQFLAGNTQSIVWDGPTFQVTGATDGGNTQLCWWKSKPSDPEHETTGACIASIQTNGENDPFNSKKPIRCVDWCDAKAFCKSAGKDLCNGVTFSFEFPSGGNDLWGLACAAGGKAYVTGSAAVSGVCNVGLSEATGQCESLLGQPHCAPAAVDSFKQCVSPPSGAVDMIGNVAEWALQCHDADGGPCQHRGGSFADDLNAPAATCYTDSSDPSDTRDRAIGLRCCTPLTDTEMKMMQ